MWPTQMMAGAPLLVPSALAHKAPGSEPEAERKLVPTSVNTTYNLNQIYAGTISSSEYFQQLLTEYPTFEDIVDVIYNECTHLEPFEPGKARLPSVAFCCLYRFFLMKLDHKQMGTLLNHKDSIYIRGVGFLYLRCIGEYKDLLGWFAPHLLDKTEFVPGQDGKKVRFGEYLLNMVLEHNYYGTILRRTPVPVIREFERQGMEIEIRRERAHKNRPYLKKKTLCRAKWSDGVVYDCQIDEPLENGNFLVTFTEYGNQDEVHIEDIQFDKKKAHLEAKAAAACCSCC